MAKDLRNKPNTEGATSKFPYGQIQDETTNQSGTPVDKEVYQDLHYFFQKLMDEAGISFNGLFENENDGYQFWQAFAKLAYETKGSDLDITFDSFKNGEKITLPDRINQVYTVTDTGGNGALQAIEESANIQAGDFVVLFLPSGITIGDNGWASSGAIKISEFFDSVGEIPYVFRYDGNDWYPESGFYHLLKNKANRTQESFKEVSANVGYNGSWTDVSSGLKVGYMKDEMGFVHLRGRFFNNGGSPNSGDTVFTLPQGYRPQQQTQNITTAGNSHSEVNYLEINTNGDVDIWFNNEDNGSCDGITFYAG